ncbi:MAG: DedA family protein [Desulfurellaceae bacterium]|jgi:membrane protein DedA with SNARE-associated domain|nr:DedA family protein [Desulfurellaceae bacterium]
MEGIIHFLLHIAGNMGYGGIFVLMFLESSFFPFPSEVVIVPTAYLASKGEMNIIGVIVAGVLGSLFGAIFNYMLACWLREKLLLKWGRFVGLTEKRLTKASLFFNKHGEISTFIGRLLPVIRQYISLPAGLSGMNLFYFSLLTFLGAGIWVSVLAFVGYTIGSNELLVKEALHNITIYVIFFSCALVGLYIYIRRRNDQRVQKNR